MPHSDSSTQPQRTIKSFVIRQGRMTPSQKEALAHLAERYCIDFSKPENWLAICQGFDEIILEIGFGMGDALLEYARNNPNTLYLGVEVHTPGVGRVLREIEKQNLQNIRILQGDAVQILQGFIPDNSLTRVHLFFPDPWPKARHHKRRIVNKEFAKLVAQKLNAQGIFHMATDWPNYAEWMLEVMDTHSDFKKRSEDRDGRPFTKFEQRGIKLGHPICDLQYQKI